MSQPLTAEESAAIDAFFANGGKAVECPSGATSGWIKFKNRDDMAFAGWELDNWLPGEMAYPEMTYYQGRPKYDDDDWVPPSRVGLVVV